MAVYPYKFEPIYKPTLWGGRNLQRLFGRALPEGKIGESWELADLPSGQSRVASGPDAGRSLPALLAEHRQEILGGQGAGGPFPLLLKYLDANDILSLQVHPDAAAAARLGSAPKDECWYVVESRGGYILKGVRPGVTAEDFRRSLTREGPQTLLGLVQRFDVQAGDFHYLPAGTVHALGPGVVVAEIQTPSDTTYRLSDWGRGRPVQVEEALACIRCGPADAAPPGAGGEWLVRSEYFAVRRREFGAAEQALAGGQCLAWMVLAGAGKLTGGGQTTDLAAGDTLLLPAGLGELALRPSVPITLLEVSLPERGE